jgi:glycosyltransferase involved in cell wall biosynthesis
MIRVGLILSLTGMWQGGVNYFHNLLSCYQQYPDAALKLEVFTDHDQDLARYRSDAIEIHLCPKVSLGSLLNWPRRRVNELLGYDPLLLKIMERHRINLLTHRGLGGQTNINTLPWLPDLQHKRFPQFFSRRECSNRDASIANVRLWGNILLSSHTAANDFRRHYPELASVQTRILHFSNTAALNVVPLRREELETQYPVREPYFFLPNQFWQHKNHAVVIEALRQSPKAIRVICTGAMRDTRDAAYVPALLDKVKQAGMEERFLCLGTVPYPALVSLMHHSLAVLQPSICEGWSTSVEESKAMCKQIILSNIDVHLEQAPERGVYFSPDSPEELAGCMKRMHTEFDPVIERGFIERRPQLKTRIERDWIENFARIVKTVSETGGQADANGPATGAASLPGERRDTPFHRTSKSGGKLGHTQI